MLSINFCLLNITCLLGEVLDWSIKILIPQSISHILISRVTVIINHGQICDNCYMQYIHIGRIRTGHSCLPHSLKGRSMIVYN